MRMTFFSQWFRRKLFHIKAMMGGDKYVLTFPPTLPSLLPLKSNKQNKPNYTFSRYMMGFQIYWVDFKLHYQRPKRLHGRRSWIEAPFDDLKYWILFDLGEVESIDTSYCYYKAATHSFHFLPFFLWFKWKMDIILKKTNWMCNKIRLIFFSFIISSSKVSQQLNSY